MTGCLKQLIASFISNIKVGPIKCDSNAYCSKQDCCIGDGWLRATDHINKEHKLLLNPVYNYQTYSAFNSSFYWEGSATACDTKSLTTYENNIGLRMNVSSKYAYVFI